MSEPEQIEIGEADIESLAAKLETLATGLTDQEQAILSHVLRTAAESASEVSGYAAGDFGIGIGVAADLSTAVGMHDISFTKKVDKSSAKLFLACANGKHFKKTNL